MEPIAKGMVLVGLSLALGRGVAAEEAAHQLPPRGADGAVSDADLRAYAARPFDKGQMMFKTVVLGTHHGNKLIAEFPCGDVCPAYTIRVIRYELKPGERCEARGGVLETLSVPQSIAMVKREFCIPPVLASKPVKGGGETRQ